MFLLDGILPALLVALIVDRLIGDPGWLYRHIPHPVEVIGGIITDLEQRTFGQMSKARSQNQAEPDGGVACPRTDISGKCLSVL